MYFTNFRPWLTFYPYAIISDGMERLDRQTDWLYDINHYCEDKDIRAQVVICILQSLDTVFDHLSAS